MNLETETSRQFTELWTRAADAISNRYPRAENQLSVEWLAATEILYDTLIQSFRIPCNLTTLSGILSKVIEKDNDAPFRVDYTLLIRRVFANQKASIEIDMGLSARVKKWMIYFCYMYSDGGSSVPAILLSRVCIEDASLPIDPAIEYARKARLYFRQHYADLGGWGSSYPQAERNYVRFVTIVNRPCPTENVLEALAREDSERHRKTRVHAGMYEAYLDARKEWERRERRLLDIVHEIEDQLFCATLTRVTMRSLVPTEDPVELQRRVDIVGEYARYTARDKRDRLFTTEEITHFADLEHLVNSWVKQ